MGDLTSRGYGAVLWEPDDKTVRDARVTRFMTWLAGLCAVGLFVYLFYALVKPERF